MHGVSHWLSSGRVPATDDSNIFGSDGQVLDGGSSLFPDMLVATGSAATVIVLGVVAMVVLAWTGTTILGVCVSEDRRRYVAESQNRLAALLRCGAEAG